MEKIIITAGDGYPLSGLFGQPEQQSRGVVLISSATCIKKEFYINFAKFLMDNGYIVLLYDYRGIGESAPADLKNSSIHMHEWGTQDMNAALNYLVAEKGFTDIIWLGHSAGAQLVGFLENKHHVRKVISINAALGYWGYMNYPMKLVIWLLWRIVAPLMVGVYGYGDMKKIGWGENLPKHALLEWRTWCLSKNYFTDLLRQKLNADRFYEFTTPITAIYMSDDYIANDRTASLMMQFFPNAPFRLIKLDVKKFTKQKVGHSGIFRKRFEGVFWQWLLRTIEEGEDTAQRRVA